MSNEPATPRHRSGYTSREARHGQIRRVLIRVLILNLIVVVAKAAAGMATSTLSVVAEAAHSSVDALSNVIALVLARIAAQAPDEEHPYGHAKFETLGALGVVALLSVTVFQLTVSAIGRLVRGGAVPEATPTVLAVMAGSALISLIVSQYEERRGHELRSDLLLADAAHTRSDLYTSLAVLVGLGLIAAGYTWVDPLITLVVAAVIAHVGWRILRTTVPVLVDERAVEPRTIRRLARESPGVVDCYDIRSRGPEGEIFVELTIAVPGDLDVERAHDIADEVERRVGAGIGARGVLVHIEPDDIQERP